MFNLSRMAQPPRNVALGGMAMEKGVERLKEKLADIEAWRARSLLPIFRRPEATSSGNTC
ncbi:hypothetical protein CDEF62S_01972 [Castellaniella defragrans]